MMIFFMVVLMTSTLLFFNLCFFMMYRPSTILGVIVYFANLQEEWHQGKIDMEREVEIYAVLRRIEKVVLVALFGWSIFCGAMLGLIDIMN